MAEHDSIQVESPRRFHFGWLFPALFRPRSAFVTIATYPHGAWLTPLLVVMILAVAGIVVAGPIKQAAIAAAPPPTPPPGIQFTPEQQAQLSDAANIQANPIFIYVFPTVISVLGIWVVWLLVVGILHLTFTLLGGRSSTRTAMNLVAWASLPFAVRDLARIGFMLVTGRLVRFPGLSGFAPTPEGLVSGLFAGLLGMVDIYLCWHIALLMLGVKRADTLSTTKVIVGVAVTLILAMTLQALPGAFAAQIGRMFASG
jgi:hypothetical protein